MKHSKRGHSSISRPERRHRPYPASLWRTRGLHLFCIALVSSALASALHLAPLRSNDVVDNFGLDAFYQVRGKVPVERITEDLPQSRDIVSIELPPNLPRRDLIAILAKLQTARVVAIDLMLLDRVGMLRQQNLSPTEQKQWYGSELQQWRMETQLLAAQLRKMPQVILGTWPEQERVTTTQTPWDRKIRTVWCQPDPLIWNAVRYHSHLTVVGDEAQSTVRSVRLWQETTTSPTTKSIKTIRQPALGLAIAALARGVSPEAFAHNVPVSPDGTTLISYLGGREAFDDETNCASYKYVLRGGLAPEDVEGKIFFIGENSLASKEIKDTPFGPMPGMNVHAMVASTLLSSQGAPRYLSPFWCAMLSLLCCSALIIPLSRFAAWSSWLVSALQCMGLLLFGGWLLGHYNLVLPLSLPFVALLMGVLGMTYYDYLLARGRLGLVVGSEAKPMLQGFGDGPHLGGHIETASAFFCDLRNYSNLAATLPLPLLAQLINAYTSTLVNVVRRHGGRPIDFQGDGMFVLFQAKKREPSGEFARRAIAAALEAQEEFVTLHPHWEALGIPNFSAAVAIATGPMMIGMVGGEKHLKPGAVGNTVNVSARLQSLSPQCGFNVLVTRETWELVENAFPATSCGWHFIKGHGAPIEVWGIGSPTMAKPEQNTDVTAQDEATSHNDASRDQRTAMHLDLLPLASPSPASPSPTPSSSKSLSESALPSNSSMKSALSVNSA